MGSVLKAMGLTIWGLIALGLIVIFIFVGYEAALKYRASGRPTVGESARIDHSGQDAHGKTGSVEPPDRAPRRSGNPAAPRAPAATRELPSNPAQNRPYDPAIDNGQKLIEGEAAEPADLSIVAQCVPRQGRTRNVLDPALQARMVQFLSETDAAKSDSGGPLVTLGELYYGFGEYELAIVSIQLGLAKGKIAHLDDAYVYLGRAEQALGDLDAARNAFGKLKDVPGISPRVLRLWTLYAQTRLSASPPPPALQNGSCP